MSGTNFVLMYHPALGNRQVEVPVQAVDEYAARGWLEVDPGSPPVVIAPYLTQAAGDSRYLPVWRPATQVLAGQLFLDPTGQPIRRTADGTTRASYDTTEQAAWTLPLRAAYGPGGTEGNISAPAAAGIAAGLAIVFGG